MTRAQFVAAARAAATGAGNDLSIFGHALAFGVGQGLNGNTNTDVATGTAWVDYNTVVSPVRGAGTR